MIKIKSITKKDTLTLTQYQGIYYILHNELQVTYSVNFVFISGIFDSLLKGLK